MFICIKMDLVSSNMKWFICHKTQPNQPKTRTPMKQIKKKYYRNHVLFRVFFQTVCHMKVNMSSYLTMVVKRTKRVISSKGHKSKVKHNHIRPGCKIVWRFHFERIFATHLKTTGTVNNSWPVKSTKQSLLSNKLGTWHIAKSHWKHLFLLVQI